MYTAESILAAIEARRTELALAVGRPVTYAEIGDAVELHPAIFSRLKAGAVPSAESIAKLAAWVGSDEALHCPECTELAADAEAPTALADTDVPVEIPIEEENPIPVEEDAPRSAQKVYAIRAVSGRLSESEDPETQAAVTRVRELLREGAVGVSVLLDIHPDDSAILGEAEKKASRDGWEKPFQDYLPSPDWQPRQRIRHTAIVDTPAYADARLALNDDGTLTGDVTYEGIYTGDVRYSADPESIVLEDSHVPSPIIWDRQDGDHTGMTVGYIDGFERVEIDGPVSGRPVLDDEAITASLAPLTMPAAYFAMSMPTGPEPLRISQPDAKGYRTIRGLAAPKGVCHRSAMACFAFPDDPDPKLKHFHTGTLLRLDDGQDIRVGAVTFAGHHLDPALASAGVKIDQANNYRDDASRVFALVRAWPTRFGLMISGVIPPDVPESQVARALACSPSVELWPRQDGRRTLLGIHIVPRPAWPVMASVGSATLAVSGEPILLEEPTGDEDEAPAEPEVTEEAVDYAERFDALDDKLAHIAEVVDAILALIPVDDVDIPEE